MATLPDRAVRINPSEVGNDAACKELYTELERLYWAEATAWADQKAPLERQLAGKAEPAA